MEREKGIAVLKTVLNNQKQVVDIEKKIFQLSDGSNYYDILYQVMIDIIEKKVDIKSIKKNLENKNILRSHPDFYQLYLDENEQNNFILKPFEVEEGISTCKKCGSKRVFSYQKQSRSSDEPSTTYCECVACRSRWTYSG